jgi:hypothetical protein
MNPSRIVGHQLAEARAARRARPPVGIRASLVLSFAGLLVQVTMPLVAWVGVHMRQEARQRLGAARASAVGRACNGSKAISRSSASQREL